MTLTVKAAVQQGAKLLEDAGVGAPRLTAEVLLLHALGKERSYLYSHPEAELGEIAWIHYGRYLHQRLSGIPTQYVTKKQEFYGRSFAVSRDVLIPRPETEHVVTAALERITPGDTVVDVGCGSGAIAVTLALESSARLFASDISYDALGIARKNASKHGASVSFVAGDLLKGFRARSLQMVVSNPPYVGLIEKDGLQREVLEHEPHVALFGGERGNEIYGQLIGQAAQVLRPGGWIVLELGWKSEPAVRECLDSERWDSVEAIPDLAGYPRVMRARLR